MEAPPWITYTNQNAVRNQPISPRLMEALSFLPEMGLGVEIFSGGQPAIGTSDRRVGSTRHDDGDAADVFFTRGGRRLDWRNPADLPVIQGIVARSRAAGLTGIGAGPGYMQPGSLHVGFGDPAVWGADGKGANAPEWLREAYYGGAAPSQAMALSAPQPPQQPARPRITAQDISDAFARVRSKEGSEVVQTAIQTMQPQYAPAAASEVRQSQPIERGPDRIQMAIQAYKQLQQRRRGLLG